MPKNPVTDPISDQEMAFARLILSGTMNDREAAEAVGLSPSTAAYTKARPRVRAYMIEHRAAVSEKLAEDEAEGLRNLRRNRDQILARLWQLANCSPEQTRGSIVGQIKAMSMIVAIEGLIPDRRRSPAQAQPQAVPGAPFANPLIPVADPYQPPQSQREDIKPDRNATVDEARSAASRVPGPGTRGKDNQAPPLHPAPHHPGPVNPFIRPETLNGNLDAIGRIYDTNVNPAGPLSLSLSLPKAAFARPSKSVKSIEFY